MLFSLFRLYLRRGVVSHMRNTGSDKIYEGLKDLIKPHPCVCDEAGFRR